MDTITAVCVAPLCSHNPPPPFVPVFTKYLSHIEIYAYKYLCKEHESKKHLPLFSIELGHGPKTTLHRVQNPTHRVQCSVTSRYVRANSCGIECLCTSQTLHQQNTAAMDKSQGQPVAQLLKSATIIVTTLP